MNQDDYILIGQVKGVHGLHGNLKVAYYTESIDVYAKGVPIVIREPSLTGKSYIIKDAKPYKKGLLLSVDGVSDISSAEKLMGSDIFLEKALLPETEEGVFYWFDIIGLSVQSKDGTSLGVVTSIFPTGSNDVYVVEDNGEERLIPALESVVLSIDLDSRTMIVDLPEGL